MQAPQYIFILGRYPDLSRQEIFSVLKRRGESTTTVFSSDQVLILQSEKALDIEQLNKTLGGTVKIGKVIHQMPDPVSERQLTNYFTSDTLFIDFLEDISEKVTFGISYYPENRTEDRGMHYTLSSVTKAIKSHLEAQGFKVRYPKLEGINLSSASVEKNKLLTQGAEILLLKVKDTMVIGKTLAVQEFESFSRRDYGRPSRDMDSGIMPPKIARMMINLTEAEEQDAIIDPFCGSGTLLQEALMLNFTHIIGTDISEKAIEDTQKNITWLTQRNPSLATVTIRQCDALKLAEVYGKASFDAVVGEPYMGPNFQERPPLSVMQKNRDELELFYTQALEVFANILKPGGVIVMILPVFHTGHHYLSMDIFAKMNTLGLNLVSLSESKRQTIVTGNQYDFVLREIVKFRKEA